MRQEYLLKHLFQITLPDAKGKKFSRESVEEESSVIEAGLQQRGVMRHISEPLGALLAREVLNRGLLSSGEPTEPPGVEDL